MNKLKERKNKVSKALAITKKIILLLVFIVLIPLLLTELYLKKIGLGDPITYEADFVYGYAPKAKQVKVRFKNSKVTINDKGLRSIEDWKNNPKKKILFLGDSVTYGGSYIDDKETFSYLVCKELGNDKFSCGNAGVNAYGIFNIVYRSRYDERIQEAEIIIFNLIPDDFYRGLQNSETAHFYLNDKKFPFPAIVEAINFVSVKYDINKYISKFSTSENTKNKNNLISESIDLFVSEVDRLERINKKVLLLFSPNIYENGKISDETKYIYKRLIKKTNKKIIYLKNFLTNKHLIDSVHYNKLGHELVAQKIVEELNK
tara:strand:+ start:377 stop:1327 length:951 start_codon:yes stop_codon:yes gene_type:complete